MRKKEGTVPISGRLTKDLRERLDFYCYIESLSKVEGLASIISQFLNDEKIEELTKKIPVVKQEEIDEIDETVTEALT